MEKEIYKPRYSIFFPLLILAAGVFLLINNFSEHPYDTGSLLLSLWPLLFIAGGLDSIYKREGLFSSLLFIGLGTLFLMANLGYANLNNWHFLLRYWPIIIIAIGLDILFPLRNLMVSIIGLILAAALIVGIVYLSNNTQTAASQPVTQETLAIPAENASQADINLQLTAGTMDIGSQADPENILQGTLNLVDRSQVFQNRYQDGKTAYVTLKSNGVQFMRIRNEQLSFQDSHWQLDLNPDLPSTVDSVLVAGQMNTDLSGMDQLEMENTVIFGQSVVILPQQGDVNLFSSVIFGELQVRVPEDANALILIDTTIDNVSAPQDFRKTGNKIYSPNYDANDHPVTIKLSVPFGGIDLRSIP